MNLVKSFGAVLGILVISLFLFQGCTFPTGSTAGGSSGTGAGWTITIQIGTNPLPFTGYSTTTVMATVRDSNGAPAPKGTNVCFTAVLNGFLKSGSTTLYASVCEGTTNDLGQSIQVYSAQISAGDDPIEVSSQGVIARTIITNS